MCTTDDVAVFFDFENIAISLRNQSHENPNFKALMDKCRQYGRVILARAYADWGNHHNVVYALHTSGFDPVYVPTYSYGSNGQQSSKNAVDIQMAIQAVEILYTREHVNTFILMTGDKDFVPLALTLRQQGKRVVVFAVKKTASNYLQGVVDEIIFYSDILERQLAAPEVAPAPKPQRLVQPDRRARLQAAFSLLQQTVEQAQAEGKSLFAAAIKPMMRQQQPGFDEKQLRDGAGQKFRRFTDFIRAAEAAGLVKVVEHDDQAVVYPAAAATATPAPSASGAGEEKSASAASTPPQESAAQLPSENGSIRKVTAKSERDVIVEALKSCRYPATLNEISRHCQHVRESLQIDLPNRHIWELLQEAIGAGLLREVVGMRPGCYELINKIEVRECFLESRQAC